MHDNGHTKKTFPYVKQLYIDDVYLGIVADLLNITLSHDRRFETKYVPGQLRTLLSSHEYGLICNDVIYEVSYVWNIYKVVIIHK
jgi:hypothetical protein